MSDAHPEDLTEVVEADEIAAAGAAVIEVPDTQAAVTALARAWRDRLEGRVIGITGSTGKTTTKNLVRDVLAAAGSVCATKGNQNNELGVPNTVLAAQADTDALAVDQEYRVAMLELGLTDDTTTDTTT